MDGLIVGQGSRHTTHHTNNPKTRAPKAHLHQLIVLAPVVVVLEVFKVIGPVGSLASATKRGAGERGSEPDVDSVDGSEIVKACDNECGSTMPVHHSMI